MSSSCRAIPGAWPVSPTTGEWDTPTTVPVATFPPCRRPYTQGQCGALPPLPGFYPPSSCAGPTPYCPRGLSKHECPYATAVTNAAGRPYVEVGYVYCTDAQPVTTYMTKSCARATLLPSNPSGIAPGVCTGCRGEPVALDGTNDGNGGAAGYLEDQGHERSAVPLGYRAQHEAVLPYAQQRAASAFERKTIFTNLGMGYGPFAGAQCGAQRFQPPPAPTGARHGMLHATGCKCNRCSQDLFYHPRTGVYTPQRSRWYRLLARERLDGSSRLSYAVQPMAGATPSPDGSFETAPIEILPLADDPRHWAEDLHERSYVQLQTGDQIYIPGEDAPFFVHMYADDAMAGVYRPNQAVFRGWSPVRPLRGKQNIYNSALRNLNAYPDPTGLLRPR